MQLEPTKFMNGGEEDRWQHRGCRTRGISYMALYLEPLVPPRHSWFPMATTCNTCRDRSQQAKGVRFAGVSRAQDNVMADDTIEFYFAGNERVQVRGAKA